VTSHKLVVAMMDQQSNIDKTVFDLSHHRRQRRHQRQTAVNDGDVGDDDYVDDVRKTNKFLDYVRKFLVKICMHCGQRGIS
jgi:hypothetical protein